MEIFGIDDDEESQDSQASSTKLNSYTSVAMKISSTPLDSISSIHNEVQVVLTSMRSFDKFDISHLEERLKMLFDRAAVYDTARSASLNEASKEILARQMKEAKDRLHETRIKESKAKEELNNLEERKRNLLALLDQQQQILQNVQVEVREIEEEIIALENTLSLSNEVAENLSTAMEQVEVAKEELENLKPFV
ncbi:hypothetical protein CDL12_22076 [Handroanthus impetiginosus]|uniref:Uncharacterized protein n=1 Tax=Handroanthus impetiginosus TaxID=429701 RepID=A0A2G9GJK9_9LAMI|nr:hypothetical protein CDL12_22076 [Handroanthus impetiginosus]